MVNKSTPKTKLNEEGKFTLGQFKKRFPDDSACLEEIKTMRYPDGSVCPHCKKESKFYRITNRTAYSCEFCRGHVYPLAGTIFEKTTTPLWLWFYAMFIMVQTRAGISAKTLQREIGVTYKTAWRMFKQLRTLMAQESSLLTGIVEVDETYIGGKGKNRRYQWRTDEEKQIVMGMIQREGKAYLKHIPDTSRYTLINQIKANVNPTARVITDEFNSYTYLHKHGFKHDVIKHKDAYVVGDIHTQNAENLWSTIKRGITGVYRVVSKKYLQAYIDEYTFRYNHRHELGFMFNRLLSQVALVKALA